VALRRLGIEYNGLRNIIKNDRFGNRKPYLVSVIILTLILAVSLSLHISVIASELPDEVVIETRETDLPIDITAIGRGEQVDITLSLRFFDLDLFSANSQRINEAMVRHRYLNWVALGADLFEVFEASRETDLSYQTAYIASNLELFSQPMAVRTLGQAPSEDEIPVLAVVVILITFVALGLIVAKFVVGRESDNKVAN